MARRDHYRRRDPRLAHDLDERQPPENLVKTYPSISYATECRLPIVAFDKLDGSNVRAEWSAKKGFYKFGTRHRLVDAADPLFGQVPALITNKYADDLGSLFSTAGLDRVMCFFEYWGPKSFAGMHDPSDAMDVTLFDVAPFKQGILPPESFLKLVGAVDHAKVLYVGNVTPDFIEQVRAGTLPSMTFEGVVCKAANDKRTKQPVMFKQKSRAWLDRLHAYCGNNKELLQALI